MIKDGSVLITQVDDIGDKIGIKVFNRGQNCKKVVAKGVFTLLTLLTDHTTKSDSKYKKNKVI